MPRIGGRAERRRLFSGVLGLFVVLGWGLGGSSVAAAAAVLGIEQFRLESPDVGPGASEAELTERLCRPLLEGSRVSARLQFGSNGMPEPGTHRLRGTMRWSENAEGAFRLSLNLTVESTLSDLVVCVINLADLTLVEAADAVYDAIPSLEGKISVFANTPGATVYVDGELAGPAPIDLSLTHDVYIIRVEHPTRLPVTRAVTALPEGRIEQFDLELRPATVTFATPGQSCVIYVEGRRLGTSDEKLSFEIQERTEYRIVLERSGTRYYRILSLDPYQDYRISFDPASGESEDSSVLRSGAAPPEADRPAGSPDARISSLSGGRVPFPYFDVHAMMSYGFGAPLDPRLGWVIGRSHSGSFGVGFCLGAIRLDGEGSAGVTEYGLRDRVTFVDGAGQDIPIGDIYRFGGNVDLCLILPLGRNTRGAGIYLYGGAGGRSELLSVRPEGSYVGTDGSYRFSGGRIDVANNYVYWVAGVTVGRLDMKVRHTLDSRVSGVDAWRAGWMDFSLGILWAKPRR